jgi:hypothetical protein
MQIPEKLISSFSDPTDDEGGGGSERDRFLNASCVAPAGLSSLFPGIRSLESSRKNTPERPTVGHLVGVLAIIRVGEKVFRRMGPSGPDAERLQVEDG